MSFQRTITLCGVWALIAFEFITYNWLFVPGFMKQYPILFPLTYLPFIVFVILLCICYYKSIVTPPGSPSVMLNNNYLDLQGIKARAKDQQRLKREMRKSPQTASDFDEIELLTRVSYCFKCDRIKPIRAHHCKICGICIQRMDHHCPWVGNCVGKDNHKYFIQFLLYASVKVQNLIKSALAILALTVIYDLLLASDSVSSKLDEVSILWLYVNGFSSLGLSLSIGFLFVTQMLTLLRNLTTLQSFVSGIYERVPWKKQTAAQNIEEITGDSSWFCPTVPFNNSGYTVFEI